jgi:hypothetical protein
VGNIGDKDWLPLSVQDETRHLALPGMVSAIWAVSQIPSGGGSAGKRQSGSANRCAADSAVCARRFALHHQQGKSELAILVGTAQDRLKLKTPLSQTYAQAAIAVLPCALWQTLHLDSGTLQTDGEPLRSQSTAFTSTQSGQRKAKPLNEVAGVEQCSANQVFFARNLPMLAATIEVRELEGLRAPVEHAALASGIAAAGIERTDVRTVTDRRTGR